MQHRHRCGGKSAECDSLQVTGSSVLLLTRIWTRLRRFGQQLDAYQCELMKPISSSWLLSSPPFSPKIEERTKIGSYCRKASAGTLGVQKVSALVIPEIIQVSFDQQRDQALTRFIGEPPDKGSAIFARHYC